MGMRKGDIETQSLRNVRSEEQGIQAGLGVSCREGVCLWNPKTAPRPDIQSRVSGRLSGRMKNWERG